ncbi:MAG: hypothetical protein ABUS47_09555 [Steroidobacter sp.]
MKNSTHATALSLFFKTVKNMGEAVLATKHSFVPPNGCTWKYTQGLRAAWIAQRNVFARDNRDIFTAVLNNTDNTASRGVSADRMRVDEMSFSTSRQATDYP